MNRLIIRTFAFFLIAFVLALPSLAQDPSSTEQQLNKLLDNRPIYLRTPHAGAEIAFDESGNSPLPVGIRGVDDVILVHNLSIHDKQAVIEGTRLNRRWDFDKEQDSLIDSLETVTVRFTFANQPGMPEVAAAINSAFYKVSELKSQKCSDLGYMNNYKDLWKKSRPDFPPRTTQVCSSIGNPYYIGWNDSSFQPARPMNHSINEAAPKEVAHYYGSPKTFSLLVGVDEKGKVTGAMILKMMLTGVDVTKVNALHDWEFQPATSNGKPVPSLYYLDLTDLRQ